MREEDSCEQRREPFFLKKKKKGIRFVEDEE